MKDQLAEAKTGEDAKHWTETMAERSGRHWDTVSFHRIRKRTTSWEVFQLSSSLQDKQRDGEEDRRGKEDMWAAGILWEIAFEDQGAAATVCQKVAKSLVYEIIGTDWCCQLSDSLKGPWAEEDSIPDWYKVDAGIEQKCGHGLRRKQFTCLQGWRRIRNYSSTWMIYGRKLIWTKCGHSTWWISCGL